MRNPFKRLTFRLWPLILACAWLVPLSAIVLVAGHGFGPVGLIILFDGWVWNSIAGGAVLALLALLIACFVPSRQFVKILVWSALACCCFIAGMLVHMSESKLVTAVTSVPFFVVAFLALGVVIDNPQTQRPPDPRRGFPVQPMNPQQAQDGG